MVEGVRQSNLGALELSLLALLPEYESGDPAHKRGRAEAGDHGQGSCQVDAQTGKPALADHVAGESPTIPRLGATEKAPCGKLGVSSVTNLITAATPPPAP